MRVNNKTYLENAFEDVKQINLNYITAKKNAKYGIIDITGQIKVHFYEVFVCIYF